MADISKSRNVSVDSLNAIANSLGARTPELAKEKHLIDKIAYEDEYHNAIRNALDVEKDEKYNKVSIWIMLKTWPQPEKIILWMIKLRYLCTGRN